MGYVIEPYDNDKMFPVFGFGGVPHHCNIRQVNHCFPLNGNINNPEINTIDGIVKEYRNTLEHIELSGPTFFAPMMSEFLQFLRSMEEQTVYSVLLILTDGTVHDMLDTIELICLLADYPCSIIIVGVGDADFSGMEILDSDASMIRNSSGK